MKKGFGKPWLLLMIFLMTACLIAAVIFFSNNARAAGLRDRLLVCPLPERTALLDSAAVAGKLTGGGNGMQYRGALLIRSELSEEALRTYYRARFPDASPDVDALAAAEAWDANILFPSHIGEAGCFQVTLFENIAAGTETSPWESLLNCDPRGH